MKFLTFFATFALALLFISPVESAAGGVFALTKDRESNAANHFGTGDDDNALDTDVEKNRLALRLRVLDAVCWLLFSALFLGLHKGPTES